MTKAMILAAGRGERMRPLTDSVPKPLLEVRGEPLIVHHLQALSRAGFSECVINLCWMGEQIQAVVGDGGQFGLAVDYSTEGEALETAGGIVQALGRLGEQFVVVNADIFTDYDFRQLTQCTSEAHLVLAPNPAHNPQGDFSLRDSRLRNAGEPRYTFTGIARYRRSFFAGLEPGTRALAPLLREAADRDQVSGELYRGTWHDVGSRDRLDALNRG